MASFDEFMESTSIHGLKYIKQRKNIFIRLIWLAIVILSFGASCALVNVLWLKFANSSTVMSFPTQHSPTDTIAFPAVTICSANRMKKSKIEEFMKTLVHLPDNTTTEEIKSFIPQLNGFSQFNSLFNVGDLVKLKTVFEENRYSISDVMNFLPQSCETLLTRCQWEGNIIDCNKLFRKIPTMRGYCCSFNYLSNKYEVLRYMKDIRHTNYFGPNMGLSFVINNEENDAEILERGGASLVIIHNNIEYPLSNKRVSLAHGGYETFVAISATKLYCSEEAESLPLLRRGCVLSNEYPLKYFQGYIESNCHLECVLNITATVCRCIPYYFPRRLGEKVCEPPDIACLIPSIVKILTTDSTLRRCSCFRLCYNTYYKTNSYFSKIDASEHSINPLYSGIKIDKNYSVVHVYFPKQVITVMRQDIFASWTTLISNLGGVYSLFLGCSFLSVIEIIHFLLTKGYATIRYHINYSKKKTKSVKSSPVKIYAQ